MVEVYIADISHLLDPGEQPEVMDGLSEKRKEKILSCRKEMNRKQSLGAGLLLKKCLDERGLSMERIWFGENEKPELDEICFNLSHSQEMVVCAVSEKPVGCDIEKIGKLRDGIANRFFTDKEIFHLNLFKDDKKCDEFYRLWTMKESYMKMTGEGTHLALDRFEFEFENAIRVYRDGKLCDCNIREYDVSGYKLSICAIENEFSEIKWIHL